MKLPIVLAEVPPRFSEWPRSGIFYGTRAEGEMNYVDSHHCVGYRLRALQHLAKGRSVDGATTKRKL